MKGCFFTLINTICVVYMVINFIEKGRKLIKEYENISCMRFFIPILKNN